MYFYNLSLHVFSCTCCVVEVSKSVQHSGLSLYQDKVEVVLRRFSVLLNHSVGLMVHRSHSLLFNAITSCEGPGNIEADGEGSGTHIKPSSGLGSNNGGIKIQVNLRFQIPTVLLEPSIPEVYGILNELLALITDLLDQVQPWLGGVSEGDEEVESVIESVVDSIHNNLEQLKKFFEGCKITCTCTYMYIIVNFMHPCIHVYKYMFCTSILYNSYV